MSFQIIYHRFMQYGLSRERRHHLLAITPLYPQSDALNLAITPLYPQSSSTQTKIRACACLLPAVFR